MEKKCPSVSKSRSASESFGLAVGFFFFSKGIGNRNRLSAHKNSCKMVSIASVEEVDDEDSTKNDNDNKNENANENESCKTCRLIKKCKRTNNNDVLLCSQCEEHWIHEKCVEDLYSKFGEETRKENPPPICGKRCWNKLCNNKKSEKAVSPKQIFWHNDGPDPDTN